jgi:hypothetical protein
MAELDYVIEDKARGLYLCKILHLHSLIQYASRSLESWVMSTVKNSIFGKKTIIRMSDLVYKFPSWASLCVSISSCLSAKPKRREYSTLLYHISSQGMPTEDLYDLIGSAAMLSQMQETRLRQRDVIRSGRYRPKGIAGSYLLFQILIDVIPLSRLRNNGIDGNIYRMTLLL